MIIISIDIVKQTYIPTSFPSSSSSFFLFYSGKHPTTLDYISVYIGQTSVIFFSFTKMHQMSLTFALSLVCTAFNFAKIHHKIVNCVYSNSIPISHEKNSTHFYTLINLNRRN